MVKSQAATKQDIAAKAIDDGVSWGLFSSLLMGLVLFVVPYIVAGVIIAAVVGEGFFDRLSDGDIGATFQLMVVSEVLALIGLALYLKIVRGSWRQLGLTLHRWFDILLVIPAAFVYFVFTTVLFVAAGFFLSEETLGQAQDTGFNEAASTSELAIAFLALVVVAPIVEELLFRGFVFKGLRQSLGAWPAIIVSALIFGLAHLQVNVGIDTFALGLVLAFLVHKTGSIYPAIVLHAMKNGLAFLLIFSSS